MRRQSSWRDGGRRVEPDALTVGRQPLRAEDGEPGSDRGTGLDDRDMTPRRRGVGRRLLELVARDGLVLFGLLALAALVRLPFLAARGSWDADQGHDLLVLRAFVRDGSVPLLGPPTSIGDFHHGALYYFLLAPAAALSGADPTAVVTEIALLGIAAVGVTWWLGRTIGGPIAGLVAGGLAALSPSAIETSTFIWNPNPIPLAAAIAYAAAWRAITSGRARWWTVAIVAAGVVMQLHVLGSVFLPAIVAVAVVGSRGVPRRRVAAAVGAGLAIVAATYVPLLIHELQGDWSETRNVVAFLTGGGGEAATLDPLQRLLFTAFRAIGWPLVGLVTDVPVPALLSVSVAIGVVLWRIRAARGGERFAVLWLGGTLLWSVVALTVMAPSLATVVEGLPNDHYHAFLDPAMFTLVGLAAAALLAGRPEARSPASTASSGPQEVRTAPPSIDRTARGLTVVALALLVIVQVAQWPPLEATDGGWPAARLAAERILGQTGERSIALSGLPVFKTTEGVEFPLRQLGARIEPLSTAVALVVVCDRLFEPVLLAHCGGPAEEKVVPPGERFIRLAARFDLSPRTSISIYLPRQ